MHRFLFVVAAWSCAAFLFVPPSASALPVRFSSPAHLTAGNASTSLTTGDFNGDGDPDLAVANQLDDNVSVRLGGAGATFPTGGGGPFGVGTEPRAVAAGLFDTDSDPDLVVANIQTDNVSVLRGNTGGSFLTHVDFPAGDGARAVAIGRFDNDSDVDLAVVDEHQSTPLAGGTVSILRGLAGVSFSAPTDFVVGGSPSWAATGDFNGDGDLDLAVANLATDDVSVLRGGSGASFSAATTFKAGDGPRSIVAADFNHDGDPDLAVANENSDDVTVMLGLAGASFSAPLSFPAGNAARSIVAVDITRDGDLDLAVADTGDDAVSVLVGGAGASFSAPVQFAAGNGPFGIAAADFNADGEQDLAVANFTSDDVSILVNTTPPETLVGSGIAGLTNDSTPTFEFAADEPGSTFECRVDAEAFAPCGTPFSTATLADGAHTFQVRAIDPAGNDDLTPASRDFMVDASPPETTIDSAPAELAATHVASFDFSANEAGSTFECRADGAVFVACGTPTSITVSDGAHAFEVRAIDPAGNTDLTPANRSFRTDTIPPETAIDSGPRRRTTDLKPTFRFSATEPGSTFECRIGSGAFSRCNSPFTTGRLAPGPQRFEVRATDPAGNRDASPSDRSFRTLLKINSTITNIWRFGAQSTRVVKLVVNAVPRGARVEIRCRGGGCSFSRKRVRPRRRRRADATQLFKGRDLRPGAVIQVRVTAHNAIGKVVRFRVRRSAVPRGVTLCLNPPSKKPTKC
jgi:hypothetical protein